MSKKNNLHPTAWLTANALKEFQRLTRGKNYPEAYKNLLAMALDQYETYITAKQELDNYLNTNRTLVLDKKAHPAVAVSQKAIAHYLAVLNKLERIEVSEPEEENSLEEYAPSIGFATSSN